MIEWFPYERAPLGRTRLRYIDLDAVLTDGKVERASKAPGFVLLFYGGEVEVLFVVGGEPISAIRLADSTRCVIPLAAAKRRASSEREWADVAYFHACEPQLRAMFATACSTADLPDSAIDPGRPGAIFSQARERVYSGVIEIRERERKVHYLVFMEGLPVHAFFADQRRASDVRANESLSTRLERLFQPARVAGMRVAGYPLVPEIPHQAPVALIDVYGDLVSAAVAASAESIGRAVALQCFTDALESLRPRRAALGAWHIAPSGRLEGDAIVAVGDLTDGVAALLQEGLLLAERAGAPAPATTLELITRPNRLLLQANGLFERLALPIQ